ncbi:MAG: response regulator transcription factor [Bacteroidetes bacterium]|nr:response regulator transcription factor [Bacteroidota bacterium]
MSLSHGKILVVEDDQQLRSIISERLQDEGFTVLALPDGRTLLQQVGQFLPDVVILDVMLPDISGFDLCRMVREKNPLLPVVMLTSRESEIDRVRGLEMGADDYVTKPFSYYELIARIRTNLRRQRALSVPQPSGQVLVFKGIELNRETREVRVRGQEVVLTATEFDLLELFIQNPNRVFTRAQLLQMVWKEPGQNFDRAVDTAVTRLRSKIEQTPSDPEYIRTIWGIGYKLTPGKDE